MPRYAAERVLLAAIDDVWAFVAEPYHLSDWWPGITGVEPDRRGTAPGARWRVLGPRYLRKADTPSLLVVHEVVPPERLSFELTWERLEVALELRPVERNRTRAVLAVEGRFLLGPRRLLPKDALGRLYDLVQTAAEL
ncbi:MAG: SRPBCC family protein [Acidobacteriota bacterium]|nr:SRPBCC family protein [Acidobacteriota bacterium]